jgi:transcriptional regulator with XRE-family HTH domain
MDQVTATHINRCVGERVRKRRSALGVSQADLGHALGVSHQQIDKYERGITNIPVQRLVELGKALKVPVSYFFENLEGPLHVASTDSVLAESRTLRASFQRVQSRRVRKCLADFTRTLADT